MNIKEKLSRLKSKEKENKKKETELYKNLDFNQKLWLKRNKLLIEIYKLKDMIARQIHLKKLKSPTKNKINLMANNNKTAKDTPLERRKRSQDLYRISKSSENIDCHSSIKTLQKHIAIFTGEVKRLKVQLKNFKEK